MEAARLDDQVASDDEDIARHLAPRSDDDVTVDYGDRPFDGTADAERPTKQSQGAPQHGPGRYGDVAGEPEGRGVVVPAYRFVQYVGRQRPARCRRYCRGVGVDHDHTILGPERRCDRQGQGENHPEREQRRAGGLGRHERLSRSGQRSLPLCQGV